MPTYRCSIAPDISAPTPEQAARAADSAAVQAPGAWTVEARDHDWFPDDQLIERLDVAHEALRRLLTPRFLSEQLGLGEVSPGEVCDAVSEAKKRLRCQAEAHTIAAQA